MALPSREVRSGTAPAGRESGLGESVIELEDLPIAYLPGDARRVRARVVGPLGA